MTHARRRAALLGLAAALLVVPLVPANAEPAPGDTVITGRLTNRAGKPLAGVMVSDGSRSVTTDADGRYALEDRYGPGSYDIRVSADIYPKTKRVHILTPGTYELSWENAPYLLYANDYVNGRDIRSLPHSFNSLAAVVDEPDVCMKATDLRTGDALEVAKTSLRSGGRQQWKASVSLPADAAQGRYAVEFEAYHCTAGTRLSWGAGDGYEVYTRGVYRIDLTAPTAEITSPKADRVTLADQDMGPSNQARVRLLHTFKAIVADATELRDATFTVIDPEGVAKSCNVGAYGTSYEVRCQYALVGGGERPWLVRVTVHDRAGRSGTAERQFYVSP